MTFTDWRRLLLLAALWGGSFIFIRVISPVLGPLMTAEVRVLIAGVTLFLYARAIKARLELRKRWRQYLTIGALNAAIPFALIATAELHITASMAAILNATSPLFAAIFSAMWLSLNFGANWEETTEVTREPEAVQIRPGHTSGA